MNKFLVKYSYTNQISDEVGLWMIIPDDVNFTHKYRNPNHKTKIQTGETLAYFNLKRGQGIKLEYTTGFYIPQKQELSKVEEEYYLRSTILSPINEEVKSLAMKIIKNKTTNKEMAKEIFLYIVNNFKYIYPPTERGVLSFISSKKGDCGEFSFLFTSLCRAVGIPTRTIMGSWAYGKMNGHAWNEYYDEESGWTPVDTSMAYIQKKQKLRFLDSSIRTLNWNNYFGKTEGQRIVFSKDTELELTPTLNEKDSGIILMNPLIINGEIFLWGVQALNGTAPYLQPVYLQFKGEVDTTPSVSNLFGSWIVKQQGVLGRLADYRKGLFSLGLLLMIFSFLLNDNHILDLLYKSIFVVASISFILRRERILIFSVVTSMLVLSLLSTITSF